MPQRHGHPTLSTSSQSNPIPLQVPTPQFQGPIPASCLGPAAVPQNHPKEDTDPQDGSYSSSAPTGTRISFHGSPVSSHSSRMLFHSYPASPWALHHPTKHHPTLSISPQYYPIPLQVPTPYPTVPGSGPSLMPRLPIVWHHPTL